MYGEHPAPYYTRNASDRSEEKSDVLARADGRPWPAQSKELEKSENVPGPPFFFFFFALMTRTDFCAFCLGPVVAQLADGPWGFRPTAKNDIAARPTSHARR